MSRGENKLKGQKGQEQRENEFQDQERQGEQANMFKVLQVAKLTLIEGVERTNTVVVRNSLQV